MPFCFQLPSGESIILHAIGNDLFLQSVTLRGFQQKIRLATDYASDLSGILFQDRLYFSYLSTDGNLMFRSTSTSQPFVRKKASASHVLSPRLLSFHDHLLLIYLKAEPYLCLTVYSPLPTEREISSADPIPDAIAVCPFEWKEELHFFIPSESSQHLYALKNDFTLQRIAPTSELALQHLSEENELLRDTIESAKTQYAQLMEVARQYREEARKWYEKYVRR